MPPQNFVAAYGIFSLHIRKIHRDALTLLEYFSDATKFTFNIPRETLPVKWSKINW